jgi:hypothetical protein
MVESVSELVPGATQVVIGASRSRARRLDNSSLAPASPSVAGTIYKDMKLKPSILDEYNEGVRAAFAPLPRAHTALARCWAPADRLAVVMQAVGASEQRPHFMSDTDSLVRRTRLRSAEADERRAPRQGHGG